MREKYFKIFKILEKVGLITLILGIGFIIWPISWAVYFLRDSFSHRTLKGEEFWQWNEGLKEFIYHAERYRLKRGDIKPHELLSYALVFNQFSEWKKHFQINDALKDLKIK